MAARRSGSPDPGGKARGKARRHLVQNGFRVFRAGVVGGEDHQVRQRRRDLSHHRALGPVPVPAAAEQAQQPALRSRPGRR